MCDCLKRPSNFFSLSQTITLCLHQFSLRSVKHLYKNLINGLLHFSLDLKLVESYPKGNMGYDGRRKSNLILSFSFIFWANWRNSNFFNSSYLLGSHWTIERPFKIIKSFFFVYLYRFCRICHFFKLSFFFESLKYIFFSML